jgi:hypothetical protein
MLLAQRQFAVHFESVKKASVKSVNIVISNLIESDIECNGPLLDNQSVLDNITVDEATNIPKELDEYNQMQAKLESDFSDIIKICEGYEANSMFHFLLKFYLKKEI